MKNLMAVLMCFILIFTAIPSAFADETTETAESAETTAAAPSEDSSGLYTVYFSTEVNKSFRWFAWTWGEGKDRWVTGQYNGNIYMFENLDSNVVFACCDSDNLNPDWTVMKKKTVDIKLDGVNNMVLLNGDENNDGNLTGYFAQFNVSEWEVTQTDPTAAPLTEATGAYVTQPSTVPQTTETAKVTTATGSTKPTQKPTKYTQPVIVRPTEGVTEVTANQQKNCSSTSGLNLSTATVKCGKVISLRVKNMGSGKVRYSSSNSSVAKVSSAGKVSALKKGFARITAKTGKKIYCFTIKVTSSPKLSKTAVSVKKNKNTHVNIIGKASTVNNVYVNTSKAKILSKKNTTRLKIKGLKKGKTTLKVKVNGVVLKLKVTVR